MAKKSYPRHVFRLDFVIKSFFKVIVRGANSNLNSKELDHFAELELELEKVFFLNSNLNSHKAVRVH